MEKQLTKIEGKLEKMDDKLDEVRINTAVLSERVLKLEQESEASKRWVKGAILSSIGAVVTFLFNLFTAGSGGQG